MARLNAAAANRTGLWIDERECGIVKSAQMMNSRRQVDLKRKGRKGNRKGTQREILCALCGKLGVLCVRTIDSYYSTRSGPSKQFGPPGCPGGRGLCHISDLKSQISNPGYKIKLSFILPRESAFRAR